eukprot:TRINITY_DN29122_c0_g1_i1.p1 TRINITY_DN29122_c0_g1~~TRINITY_DN29122_c0_g1_i1.p1  ORF type:complete len:769 (-),score=185.93 TRINITY_DN29122_c0_g1_i1:141-2447(-)
MDEIHYSEFAGRDFDPKEVVQRYRKRIPLPQLQKSLRAHHAATRQELVELINEKYADFVSLSSRMTGVERALKPLRAPLEESCELTKSLHGKLGGLLSEAEETHKALAKIEARREALTLYIENKKLLEKAKASAGQRWGNPQESDDFSREYVAQENIARDLRKIRLNLNRSSSSSSSAPAKAEEGPQASPECEALLQEASAFEADFSKRLEERLRNLVSAASRSWQASDSQPDATPGPPPRSELLAIAHVCRALSTVGRSSAVEGIFSELFVKSTLKEAAAACVEAAEEAKRKAMSGIGTGKMAGAGAIELGVFFQIVQERLVADDAPLLWLARRLRGEGGASDGDDAALLAVPSLSLVAQAVVLPTLSHVRDLWPNVFMPAFPDIFAANYAHFNCFLKTAEAAMLPAEQDKLRQSTALLDFQKRWKVQVYCSLRAKEAGQCLDVAASKGLPTAEAAGQMFAAGGQNYGIEVSAEFVRILEMMWSDRWYISSLYPKMAQLSMELIAKYGKIMAGYVDKLATAGSSGWDAGASPPTWSASSLPVALARIAADLLQVVSQLKGSSSGIAKLFLGRLPTPSGRPEEITRALLKEAALGLQPVVDSLEEAMRKHVVSAMVPQFAAIRGIPAFYRMLNKPIPTKASPYVESALRPLQAFHEISVAATSDEFAVGGWLRGIVDAATAEFASQATQLIASTRQQEASLRRLSGRGAGGEADISDLDKIHLQLCLDVEIFSSSASGLCSSAATADGLAKLAEVIAPIRAALPEGCR